MTFFFRPMTLPEAIKINHWTYEGEYSIYSFTGNEDDIVELMSGEYYSAVNDRNVLIGYLCHGDAARVPGGIIKGIYVDEDYTDIGLGLRPDLTGRNMGASFFSQGIRYLKNTFMITKFRLVVARFNIRAIKVYEKIGFYKCDEFYSKVRGSDELFISMKLELSKLEEGTPII